MILGWCPSVPAGWTSIKQGSANFLAGFGVMVSSLQWNSSLQATPWLCSRLTLLQPPRNMVSYGWTTIEMGAAGNQNSSVVWNNGNQEEERISTQDKSSLHGNEKTWTIPFQTLVSDAYSYKTWLGLGFAQATALCSTVVRMVGGGIAWLKCSATA